MASQLCLKEETKKMGTDGKALALNIPLGTFALLGRDYLNHADAQDYVLWAENELLIGNDSPSLRILAGLEKPLNSFEVKQFFDRALKELALESNQTEWLIECYASAVAQFMIDGALSAEQSVSILNQICLDSDYSEKYLRWYSIESARGSLKEGEYPWSFERLYDTNFKQVAIEEALDFLACLKRNEQK